MPGEMLPTYLQSRLRLLAEKPRAYTERDETMPTLERRGYARPTERVHSLRKRRVWEITEAGLAMLAQSEGAER